MKKVFTTLFILTSILVLTACNFSKTYDIIVSDYFTYDIVKQITADDLDVFMLQPIQMDYHTYQPDSRDLVALKRTKLFVYISEAHAPWVIGKDHLDDLLGDGIHVSFETLLNLNTSNDGMDAHHNHDHEHDHDHGFDFISNPFYVVTIIERLVEVLYDVFPQYENDFINRALAYIKKLEDLIEPVYLKRKSEETQTIYFVGHYALSGFSEAFNLNIRALDENISPNSDPSSTEVTSFIKDLKDNGVKVLYHEEIPDLNTLNYIQSQVPNLAIYELHTFHKISQKDFNEYIGYYELIKRNITNLKAGLTT